MPAYTPPKAGGAIAGEGLEGLEALHEVVKERPAQRHLGRISLPQNLPRNHQTLTQCPALHRGPVQQLWAAFSSSLHSINDFAAEAWDAGGG
jgi:hypothetical protein